MYREEALPGSNTELFTVPNYLDRANFIQMQSYSSRIKFKIIRKEKNTKFSGSVHEKFVVWIKTVPQSKFPAGIGEKNDRTFPNLKRHS